MQIDTNTCATFRKKEKEKTGKLINTFTELAKHTVCSKVKHTANSKHNQTQKFT